MQSTNLSPIDSWDPLPCITRVLMLSDRSFVIGCLDGSVIHRTPKGDSRVLVVHEDQVCALVALGSGWIVSAGWDGAVNLMDFGGGEPRTIAAHGGLVTGVAMRGSHQVVSVGDDGQAALCDIRTDQRQIVRVPEAQFNSVDAWPDGLILIGSFDGTVYLWNPDRGELSTSSQAPIRSSEHPPIL